MLVADFGSGQALWSIFWFFLFFIWIMILFRVFADLFMSKELSGVAKVLWCIFVICLPFLGVFVYLIARGDDMASLAEYLRARHVAFSIRRGLLRFSFHLYNNMDDVDRVLGLECFPTPGHASHHVCYLADDGTLYAGDAAGVRIPPHQAVLPPTPPPEFDLGAWLDSLDEIERRAPARLALVHFGVADDVERHLQELRRRLREWVALEGATEEAFAASVSANIDSGREEYERAMPFWQSYAGLKRYWEKRSAA